MKVSLSRPDVTDRDRQVVLSVLDTPVLSIGPYTEKFEQRVAGYVGRKHGVAVNSGTSGLHLAVRALGIREGDEVITTPFSFVASSNCVLYERARLVFADIDPRTLNIDPTLIEDKVTSRTRAILPVDSFGQPADLPAIRAIAERHGLWVIEDSCESLGAMIDGKMAGSGDYCDVAVFAFYPNKQITTGEGGLLVTDDDHTAYECRSMRNQGRGEGDRWLFHERLGYNYRLDEMSAALGWSQMSRIEEILARRQNVAERYAQRLALVKGVTAPYVDPRVKMSWFVYVVRLDPEVERDRVMELMGERGVQCRPYFTPIHLQPFYREMFGFKEGDFPVTERVGRSTLAIPFHNNLSREEMDYAVSSLADCIRMA